ncbi:hypothetical protein [Natronospora cellulosivora (SeqCode)]
MKISQICIILVFVCILYFSFLTCTSEELSNQLEEQDIMNVFFQLHEGDIKLREVFNFIEDNIYFLSETNATQLLVEFEDLQRKKLNQIEEYFYKSDMQMRIDQIVENKDTNQMKKSEILKINDEEVKDLLMVVKNSAYKIKKTEGMYYPVIDYTVYEYYIENVNLSNDLVDYLSFMIVELNNPPAKDAALLISWEEVLDRGYKLADFIYKYPNSLRKEEVKLLYNRYLYFTFYGLDNTPLFDHNSRKMSEELRYTYINFVNSNYDNIYTKVLKQFLDLLEEHNYVLTSYVDNYIKEIILTI